MPGRTGAPAASPIVQQAPSAPGTASLVHPGQAPPSVHPQRPSAATKRRRRLLPLVLVVVVACGAVGAFLVYRSSTDSSAGDSASQSAPSPSPSPARTRNAASDSTREALGDFFTSDYLSSSPIGPPAQYPERDHTLVPWTVRTLTGPYTAWIIMDDSGAIVVRTISDDLRANPAAADEKRARKTAELFAYYYGDKQRDRSLLEEPPRAVTSAGGSRDHFTFVWQLKGHGPDGADVLFPRWVSVSIDRATGKLLKYDSLALATGKPPEPDITLEKAIEKAGAPKDAEAILELAPRWTGGGWQPEPTLFWRVTVDPEGARAGADEVFIVAAGKDAGDIVGADELYVPSADTLPEFEELTPSAAPASSPTPEPSGTSTP